ncbi:MAG: ECF transporter S component [Ruminococcus sp.]|nr:ECF transporter S component [Ruminococcus sp.]
MGGSRRQIMLDKTKNLVGTALLTALVIVLQCLSLVIPPIGPFRISLVLIPIVVGAAMYGYKAGAWLGAVFGVVVVMTDAGAFLAVNVIGTVITCILKGALAGLCAGLVYKLIENKNRLIAVIAAALITPVVNTGIFLLGCSVFFMDTINEWAAGAGYASAGAFMIYGLVGVNFLIEIGVNIVLNPVIVRILNIVKKS